MANKRQRKKQQTKKNVERLKKSGASKQQIKQLKNKPQAVRRIEKKHEQFVKRQERNERAARRYKELVDLGVPKDQARKMRYWSDEHYEKEVEKVKRRKARKKYESTGKFLTIYWRDKTEGFAPDDAIQRMKHEYQYVSIDYLIESIKGFMQVNEGEIGDVLIVTSSNQKSDSLDFFYDDWHNVYHGKAARYKELLIAINAIVGVGLYDTQSKSRFIYDMLQKLDSVNPRTAKRLAKDLDITIRGI